MKTKQILQSMVMACTLVLSTTASALYIDVGAAGGLGQFFFEDGDTKTGSIDSIIFGISTDISDPSAPLPTADTGLVTGVNMTDVFDDDDEGLGTLFSPMSIDYNSTEIILGFSNDFGASFIDVAILDMNNFDSSNPGRGFEGIFTWVLADFWFSDDGNVITQAMINDPTNDVILSFDAANASIDAALVSEPSILPLLGLGLLGLGIAGRRRKTT